MPQASNELRKLVNWIIQSKLSTEVPADGEVIEYLTSRGYVLTRDATWKLPKADHYVNEMEELCLRYLVDEWDYGWIEPIKKEA